MRKNHIYDDEKNDQGLAVIGVTRGGNFIKLLMNSTVILILLEIL